MIRIGFDPMLEAEQQHQQLIKEVEHYRVAKMGLVGVHSTDHSINMLALIGKGMSSLGASLERRFGNQVEAELDGNQPIISEGCR